MFNVGLSWYFSAWGRFLPSNSRVFKCVQVTGPLELRTSEHHELLNSEVNIDEFNTLIETKIYFAGRHIEQSTKVV